MSNEKIKIGIVDNNKLIIDGISAILAEFDDFEIAFTAFNGDELLNQLEDKKADVLLLDYHMPGLTGKELSEKIKNKYKNTSILILSIYNDLETIRSCLEVGVDGYMSKEEVGVDELRNAILCVMNNGTYFSPTIKKKITDRLGENDDDSCNGKLTKTEIKILRLICKELTTKEIAGHFFRSINTIETHRRSIIKKTESKNIVGAVLYAIRMSLIPGYYYRDSDDINSN